MGEQIDKLILPLARYRVRYALPEAKKISNYLGSAIRGAFGHALKKTVCVTRAPHCESCALYRTCAYSYIFETPPPAGSEKMRRYTAAPHPFVFELPFADHTAPESKVLDVGFTLLGRGNQFLSYVIHAMKAAGQRGIGGRRTSLTLERVEQATDWSGQSWEVIYHSGNSLEPLPVLSPDVPPAPKSVSMHFETPLRLRRNERNVSQHAFQFDDLFVTLLRRISMLTYFHTDQPHETDFAGLAERARQMDFADLNMRWQDWTRYSSRQKTSMQMGGLVGAATLDLQNHEEFWPYLWLGQWTHVGKATSMGLGRYRIEGSASLPEQTEPVS